MNGQRPSGLRGQGALGPEPWCEVTFYTVDISCWKVNKTTTETDNEHKKREKINQVNAKQP